MLFNKKKAPAVQEPMDLDSVMKKFDRESNTRIWEGVPKILVSCALAIFALYLCHFVCQLVGRTASDNLCGIYRVFRLFGLPCQKGRSESEQSALV